MKNEENRIQINDVPVRMKKIDGEDYVCISDIAKSREAQYASEVIRNYLRNRENFDFLALWERTHNPNVNSAALGRIEEDMKDGGFIIRVNKYIESTNAIGFIATKGRYASTFAHIDIAIDFCSWFNRRFYLYLIKEFRRLKGEEANLALQKWDLRRELVKASYEIHTDAIREHLTPLIDWHTKREKPLFASEADLLNQAVFGMTAKEFKQFKPDFKGNLRDYATTEQLEILNGLQHLNAGLIEQGLTQGERFQILYRRAQRGMKILEQNPAFKQLKE